MHQGDILAVWKCYRKTGKVTLFYGTFIALQCIKLSQVNHQSVHWSTCWLENLIFHRKSSTKPKLYRERSIQANGYQKCSIPFEQLGRAPKKVSIIPVLWNSFYGKYLNATALKLASDVLMFVSPQILR